MSGPCGGRIQATVESLLSNDQRPRARAETEPHGQALLPEVVQEREASKPGHVSLLELCGTARAGRSRRRSPRGHPQATFAIQLQSTTSAAAAGPEAQVRQADGLYQVTTVGRGVSVFCGRGLVLAGIGFLAHQSWWGVFGIAAGAVALVLMVRVFNLWLLAGIAISAGILCHRRCRRPRRLPSE